MSGVFLLCLMLGRFQVLLEARRACVGRSRRMDGCGGVLGVLGSDIRNSARRSHIIPSRPPAAAASFPPAASPPSIAPLIFSAPCPIPRDRPHFLLSQQPAAPAAPSPRARADRSEPPGRQRCGG